MRAAAGSPLVRRRVPEPTPVATFLARPEGYSLRVRVRVFATLADLRAYVRWTGRPDPRACKAVACTERVEMVYSGADAKRAGRTMKLKARVGEILFARRYLSCEIVVHETTHIALYMARRLGITPADDGQCVAGYLSRGSGNERFSYLLGTLANSVVRGLRRHGLIGEDSDAAPRLRHA